MKLRFYRTAEPGGGSGAGADNTAAGTNPPGAQGGDGSADPNKSAASAVVTTGGSGAGDAPPQPKAPTTLEEANALLAEKDKALADFETKLKAKDDVLKAKREKFASKIRQERDAKALRASSLEADFEPVKPRGADGKYTQQDLEDIQRQSVRKLQAEQAIERREEEMRDYVVDFAESLGLKADAVTKAESVLASYLRLFVETDEKDPTPPADEVAQIQLFEDLLKGMHHEAIVESRVKEAIAERDKYWAAKIGHAGAPEGGNAGTVLTGPVGGGERKVDPALASVAESIKRIRSGA